MTNKTRVITLLGAAALATATTAAVAGKHYQQDVKVSPGAWAQGILSSARNSADDVQYLGCQLIATKGMKLVVWCFGSDAKGETAACFSEDPAFITTATSLNGDSWLEFYVGDEHECHDLMVWNSSEWEPK
jgi:hypothetical protein